MYNQETKTNKRQWPLSSQVKIRDGSPERTRKTSLRYLGHLRNLLIDWLIDWSKRHWLSVCWCGVEGPFKDASEVRQQRCRPLQPTLRAMSEYVSTSDQLRRTENYTRCAQIRCLQWQLFLTLFCVHYLITTICLVSLKALVENCKIRRPMLCRILSLTAYCM